MTFAAVARPVAEHGWRPFPGIQTSKVPAMAGWPGLNDAEWDAASLAATVAEYQPADAYCCCLAVQAEIVAIDLDIVDQEHAAFAAKLAADILGATPLVRIGLAPKHIRIYRAGDHIIRSRRLHPLEIFCGSGQFVGFGWHEKAGRPYLWPHESPLTIRPDNAAIPAVTRAKLDRFGAELFKVIPRRLLPTKQGRPGDALQTIGERLRMLTTLHGSWKRAANIVVSEAGEGTYNETWWAVVASAAGRGIPEETIWELFDQHFTRESDVSETTIRDVLATMIKRTRPVPRQSAMTFTPIKE
jgi:Bifunctional DNA primase/polymerase, N-terminal